MKITVEGFERRSLSAVARAIARLLRVAGLNVELHEEGLPVLESDEAIVRLKEDVTVPVDVRIEVRHR